MAEQTLRSKLEIMRVQMESDRSSFLPHWRDLGDQIAPRRPRFYTSDVNRGDRRNQKIIDATPVLAARTTRAGMMGGVTSPARPWFRLGLSDSMISKSANVKKWLDETTDRMNSVFLKSNLYNALPIIYGDLATFGTSAMFMEEDFENVLKFTPIPIGSYMIANSERGKVEVFFREFKMTVRQIIQKFARAQNGEIDWSKVSTYVRNLYDQNNQETWLDVCHAVFPNDMYDDERLGSNFKRFRSVYYEKGTYGSGNYISQPDEDKSLSDKGYDYFPVLAPRWEVTGEDVYGTSCPGMDALGDIKQLQLGERRIAQAIELLVRPPMKGPTTLRATKASSLPGDITYVDERATDSFKPLFQVDPRVSELEEKQQQIRQRISRAFFEDLFLMLANSDRRQITAREIDERHEEKLLALGPVLEQLNQDLLDPLIDFTFAVMLAQGLIDVAPEEIHGQPLKVDYISIMAQAQKLAGLGSIERFAGFAGEIIKVDPDALDKVDTDELLDWYADITSMRAGVVRPNDEVSQMRARRAQAQEQQAKAQAMSQGSQTAKNLSQTNLDGNNALSALIDQSQAGAIA